MSDIDILDFEEPETCPNCGQFVGQDSVCPNCGAMLYDEESNMNIFEEESNID